MSEAADHIIDLYERHARHWDADRNRQVRPWVDKPWHERFARSLPLGASILDLGCGSGAPVATYLAGQGHRITGVDASPTLISLCEARLPDHRWSVGDMRSLVLPERFDGVLAWDSFFHLAPDHQRAMFARFDRLAKPSAVLMFNTGPASGEAIGSYRGEALYHASLDAADYEDLLSRIGFRVLHHAVEDWAHGGGRTVWMAQR